MEGEATDLIGPTIAAAATTAIGAAGSAVAGRRAGRARSLLAGLTFSALTARSSAPIIAADRVATLSDASLPTAYGRRLGVDVEAHITEVGAAVVGDLTGDRA